MRNHPLLAVCVLLLSAVFGAGAAPLRNYPQTLVQPDGSSIHCFASGDEFNHWLHDAQNYTIVRDSRTGWFVYAVLENGTLAPSSHIVGKVNPAAAGLSQGINISADAVRTRKDRILARMAVAPEKAWAVGTINNIVIFIRFADEAQNVFPDSISKFQAMFNSATPSANSMYNYFREVSYNQLAVLSALYPLATDSVLSYVDSHPRKYFQKYNGVTNPWGYGSSADRWARERTLLANAINAVAPQVPPGLNLDANGDGLVDAVCFVVSGDVDASWASILWPHQDYLDSYNVTLNQKRVSAYNIQVCNVLFWPSQGVCALVHEMFHSFGSPDLYHYSFDGLDPARNWDIMDDSPNPPVHMSAYMKWKYGGWIDSIPTISTPGTYTLSPLASATNNCYRVASPFSSSEYFVVEYRKRSGTFEASLPGEGLLVYRINTTRMGNETGPPDEVYVYRPGGTPSTNGKLDSAAFSSNSGRVSLTDSTNPRCFLSDGSAGGLNISNVGIAGDSITFTLKASLPAIMAVTPPSVTFGLINANVISLDTVLLISNKGLTRDSVRVTIDSGNVTPSLAIRVRPTEFDLPGETTRTCTVSVNPSALQGGIAYTARIFIDGTPGPGQKHFEIPVAFGVVTGIKVMPDVPKQFALDQNYPNPFNPSTTIKYELPRASYVTLTVYDVLGREVATLVNGAEEPGYKSVRWDASGVSSGIYFYRLQAGDFVQTKKLLLLR